MSAPGRTPERVFVTGLGAITPAGAGVAALWDDLLAGRSRFQELEPVYAGMRPGTLGARVDAEARAAAVEAVGDPGLADPRRTASLFARYAALEARQDAGLEPDDPRLRDAVVCVGSSDGQAPEFERVLDGSDPAGQSWASHVVADEVASCCGSAGPAFAIHNTCASANVALASGLSMLRAGIASTAVIGGCDPYSERNLMGFASLQAIGAEPCRPFSTDRRFVTPSEGSCFLVLQTESSLRAGQEPYAEVLASAVNNDAKHPTAPDPDGVDACHAQALAEAGVDAESIEVVYAHGTGSKANDEIESEIFQRRLPQAAVTAPKATLGHLMGAAGAVGAVAGCLTLRHELVPPTPIGDPDHVLEGLDLVVGDPRPVAGVRVVQNNAFGFGGNNAISILRKPS